MAYEKAFFHKELAEFFTPRIVLAWPNVLVARRIKDDTEGEPRFTVTGLVPHGRDITVLLDEWNRAGKDEHGTAWVKKKLNNPPLFETAGTPDLGHLAEQFPWAVKMAAKQEYKPLIYGPDIKPWEGEASEIYSGRRALLGGKFRGYKKGKGGAGFYLNRVILLEPGERLPLAGGGPRPISADGAGFEPIDIGGGESASEMFA